MTKMAESRVSSMNDVIQGIARRSAHKFFTKSAEELAQELWVTVLEKEASAGCEFDLDLVAKICYDKIVDIQRYDSRRNTISLDPLRYETQGEESTSDSLRMEPLWETISAELISGSKFEEKVVVDDLFKIFPEGSKERLFLEFWGTATGVKDFGIQGTGKYEDGFTESSLAKMLGYAGTASGGYKKFRSKMRNFVAVYFDLD